MTVASTRDLTTLSLAELKREDERLLHITSKTPGVQTRRLRAVRVEIEIRRDQIKAEKRAMQQRALDLKEREIVLAERHLDEMIASRERLSEMVEDLAGGDDDDVPPFPPFLSNRVGRG